MRLKRNRHAALGGGDAIRAVCNCFTKDVHTRTIEGLRERLAVAGSARLAIDRDVRVVVAVQLENVNEVRRDRSKADRRFGACEFQPMVEFIFIKYARFDITPA